MSKSELQPETWLSRITINEALGRLRARRPTIDLATFEVQRTPAEIIQFPLTSKADDPEQTMAQRQLLQLVEQATDKLPEVYRIVFITRDLTRDVIEQTLTALQQAEPSAPQQGSA